MVFKLMKLPSLSLAAELEPEEAGEGESRGGAGETSSTASSTTTGWRETESTDEGGSVRAPINSVVFEGPIEMLIGNDFLVGEEPDAEVRL